MTHSFFRRVVSGTYSGLQRYPRHLWRSVHEAAIGDHGPDDLVRPPWAGNGSSFERSDCHSGMRGLSATWIGHATVLIRVAGVTILTDPVFSKRIGMSVAARTFGLARLAPPACKLDDLPPVDVILLSHAHFDHLDKPTLKHLAWDRTVVVTASRTRRLIPRGFAEVVELPWGETFRHRGVSVTALRPAHWGARAALDQRRGYSSYVIDAAGSRVFFAGDTADTRSFDAIDRVDLAIFGIGAYEPWIQAHANPEQVWEMFTRMRAARLMPMHHSTFELGREPLDEPLRRLELAARGRWDRVIAREIGESWQIPAA